MSCTHQHAGAWLDAWTTLFFTFTTCKVSPLPLDRQGKWRLCGVIKLPEVTSSEGQAKIHIQGRAHTGCTQPPTPHPQVAVPTAAQGFLQVCLRPSASPEASLCFQCIRSLHRLSPWGTLGRLMPSAPEGVPANAIPSSRLASTVPRPMGMAPAWWCHWMVLSGSIRPELLSAAHLHWGWGKTEGSSGLLSQLAAGAADAQHIPLLWEVYRHRGWMRQILHPGWFSIFISLTIRQGLCIKSTLWSTTDLKLSEEDGKTEKWVLSNLTEVESEGKYPILVIKSSSC